MEMLPCSFLKHLLVHMLKKDAVGVEDACNMACVCRLWRDVVMRSEWWWKSKGTRPRYTALANYNHYDEKHRRVLFNLFKLTAPMAVDIISCYARHVLKVSMWVISVSPNYQLLESHPAAHADTESVLITATLMPGHRGGGGGGYEYFQLYFCCDNRVVLMRLGHNGPWTMLRVRDLIAPYKSARQTSPQ
jgi:hypothetical protein